jgi:hypothetical protein
MWRRMCLRMCAASRCGYCGWRVGRRRFGRSFATKALADSFHAQLLEAARAGESFDAEIGLPDSMVRRDLDVSCYVHAREFMQAIWPTAAARAAFRYWRRSASRCRC